MTSIDFDLFLAWRGFTEYIKEIAGSKFLEHAFLDGCAPTIQNQCLAQAGYWQVYNLGFSGNIDNMTASTKVAQAVHTSLSLSTNAKRYRDCSVEANGFVLIYFPTTSNVSRDFCANDGWGEDIHEAAPNRTVTKTATLDQIIFESRNNCKLSVNDAAHNY
jgi:hypothetical protein